MFPIRLNSADYYPLEVYKTAKQIIVALCFVFKEVILSYSFIAFTAVIIAYIELS